MKKSLITISIFAMLFLGSREIAGAYFYASGSSAKLNFETAQIKPEDNRVKILEEYLNQYDSPLAEHADTFVEQADKYNLDWRLLVSIAGLESGYGHHLPISSHNAWGWGYNNGTVKHFDNWDEAIVEISSTLREKYLRDIEYSDPYIIGPTYAASPTWAERVTYFMNRIEDYRLKNATSTLELTI